MSSVNIVAYTQAKTSAFENIEGGEEDFIAYCARVSNPENQNNSKTAPKLLAYLIKNKHWSPFEMASVTMEITTTSDISRQILRHRSFSFQEFSQRYAVSEDFCLRETRIQDKKNRQNSTPIDPNNRDDVLTNEYWLEQQAELIKRTKSLYKWALDAGIAKEQARAILPEGNTGTTLYMAGTLRSWVHYCQLRGANGTQKEHSEIADLCWEELKSIYPNVIEACELVENWWA